MKNRKTAIAIIIMLIASPILAMFTPTANSLIGSGQGYGFTWWVSSSAPNYLIVTSDETQTYYPEYKNDTLAFRFPYNWNDDTNKLTVTFLVNNTLFETKVERVQMHIHMDDLTKGALFHYIESKGNSTNVNTWGTRILEKDSKGWATLIEFYDQTETNGFGFKYIATFNVTFGQSDRLQTVMPNKYYDFAITSADNAGGQQDQNVYWYFSDKSPDLSISIYPPPDLNDIVTGDLLPTGCGHHYFNVTFTAQDALGLLNYTLSIVGPDPRAGNYPSPVGWIWPNTAAYTNVTQWVDFLEGDYTVTVTVFNRIGLGTSKSISFHYKQPQKPIQLSPTSGYAASETWIVNAASGLVNSTQTIYGNKTFGTIVTVSGYGFGANKAVRVTVYLPTYYDYYLTYGTSEVLVAKPTTDAYGNYTTWFIFPKAPMGTYNVTGVSATYTCATTFQVLPQVIYNPNSVIGPAVVNVEATGFPMPSVVPGPNNWNKILILCNNKDTLLGIDSQVLEDWYIDANGTLQNVITGVLGGRRVHNGIVWPALQPGTYNLTLVLYTNDQVTQPLWYWNSPTWQSITTNYFEHTNTITVEETLSLLIDIKDDTAYIRTATNTIISKLDQLSATITRIDGNVVTINTTVGSIKATLDQLSPVITRIDGNVVTINTVAGSINTTLNTLSPVITRIDGNVVTINSTLGPMSTTLDAINAKIISIDWTGLAAMNTALGSISGNVTEIRGNVVSIKANTDTIPGISSSVTSIKANTDTIPAVKTNADNIPGLTTPIYIAVVLSLIAAIAAIAGAFLIYRKTA
jgi:hypothetical protein